MAGIKPEGGPAFPVQSASHYKEGMTLRDYFAGQACIGLLQSETHCSETAKSIAERSYRFADAMIKASLE